MNFLKYFKVLVLGLLVFLSGLSLLAFFFSLFELFQFEWDFSKNGLKVFLDGYKEYFGLFTGTIILISVYYWVRQIENIEQSNRKKLVENTIAESRYFYSKIQPIAGDFIFEMRKIDESLFDEVWDYSDFSRDSVREQNGAWLNGYRNASDQVENFMTINQVFFELEGLSSAALNGDIDENLLFKLMGKSYCHQIKALYPFISTHNDPQNQTDYFENIPKLFQKWNEKL